MKKVLIADDHAVVRQGIKQILVESGEFQVVDEATNFPELRSKIGNPVDVVVMDLSMPGGSCLELLQEIRNNGDSKRVLVLSVYPEEEYGIRALKSGALGFLSKECLPEELVSALKKVSSGGRYISLKLADLLASQCSGDGESPLHQKLSNREYQVLLMIGSGLAPGEISKELHLSVKTVSTYRTRILEKLGLKTNAQLIHYVVSKNIQNLKSSA